MADDLDPEQTGFVKSSLSIIRHDEACGCWTWFAELNSIPFGVMCIKKCWQHDDGYPTLEQKWNLDDGH